MRYLWISLFMVSAFCFSACHTLDDEAQEVLDSVSPEQKAELASFIKHFSEDDAMRETAKFIVANMMGKESLRSTANARLQAYIDSMEATKAIGNRKGYMYARQSLADASMPVAEKDVEHVHADSLANHLDTAYKIWQQSAWSKSYSEDVFNKYVAPYRVADEPLEYGWRTDAYKRYVPYLPAYKDSSLVKVCAHVYRNIEFWTNNLFWGEPLQSYSDDVRYKRGTCADHAVYVAMVMRALGIPTSVELIPFWGDNNNGHTFNALLLPDGTCKGYNNREDLGTGLTLSGKVPKVYRREFEIQRETALYTYKDSEYIPPLFSRHDLKDVTACYDIPMTDVTVYPELYHPHSRIAYLSVFSIAGWQPVAWTECRNGKAVFRKVGVGYTSHELPSTRGESYGEGGLFLPVCYESQEPQPLAYPFILKEDGSTRCLMPDTAHKETITLYRKFPRKKRIVDFARNMSGGYFELANTSDFTDADRVYFIDSVPVSHIQTIRLPETKRYRYLRYRKRRGVLSLGEMGALDDEGETVSGKMIADKVLAGDAELKNICDGDVLSYYHLEGIDNLWVGLDFGKAVAISRLFFCPRTDDNDIAPGDEYELFYWDKGWVSLGKQTATEYRLVYADVPQNALLWLRDVSKGREERPFTYERGKQIWW